MSTGDPPLEKAAWTGGRRVSRLPIRPRARRTDNSGAVSGHRQVRFAKFRSSATPFILKVRRATAWRGKRSASASLPASVTSGSRPGGATQPPHGGRPASSQRPTARGVRPGAAATAPWPPGGGGTNASATPPPTPTPSPTATATPTAPPTPPQAAEPASHCTYAPNGTAARKVGAPPAKPAYKGAQYKATVKTNRGTIVLD